MPKDITSIDQFYKEISAITHTGLDSLLPAGISAEIGHFNVFDLAELIKQSNGKPAMPYNRRAYFKISLICGHNIAEYADKVIEVKKNALLFATPRVPYNWLPQNTKQSGHFCVFTHEFILPAKSGVLLDELPIFKAGGYPIFQLSDSEAKAIRAVFSKMHSEIGSSYAYKYDLLRTYVLELIHAGQKLQPITTSYPAQNASARVSSLFIELLERQFPIESPMQQLQLRTAKDYADRLAVHVNHLNKVLKEQMGKTTTEIISGRLVQEAKILLRQTNWNISEIGYSLGFEEVAHFSNFFKKQTAIAPLAFRA